LKSKKNKKIREGSKERWKKDFVFGKSNRLGGFEKNSDMGELWNRGHPSSVFFSLLLLLWLLDGLESTKEEAGRVSYGVFLLNLGWLGGKRFFGNLGLCHYREKLKWSYHLCFLHLLFHV